MASERVIVAQRIYAMTNGQIDLSKPVNISGSLAHLSYQYNSIPDSDLVETTISLENRQIVIPWSGHSIHSEFEEVYNEKMEYIENHFYVINRDEAIVLGLEEEFDRINYGKGITKEDENCLENPCPPDIEVIEEVSICEGESVDLSTLIETDIEDYVLQYLDSNGNELENSVISPLLSEWYKVRVIGNPDTYNQECNSEFSDILIYVNKKPNLIILNPISKLDLTKTTIFTSNINGGIWSSSNEEVATIDAETGLVQPKLLGTTIISYYYETASGCSNTTSTELVIGDCTPEFELPTNYTTCIKNNVNIKDLIENDYSDYEIVVTNTTTSEIISYIVSSDTEGSITYEVYISVDGCKSETKQITIDYIKAEDVIVTKIDQPEYVGFTDWIISCHRCIPEEVDVKFSCIPIEVSFEIIKK
ncbi:MAG: hypothetical protein M0R03_08900 [Novosphingobium sp.]|nr:hypothetical protein [Novosphingobium sp.]